MKKIKATLLLVEDDENLGFVTKDILEDEGFVVNLCADGEKAIKAFQTGKFDICLIDIMLPKMDGFTVAQIIKEENPIIPILFVTARSMKEDKIKGLKLGADDYITKPFDFDELVLRINNILQRSKQQKTTSELEEGEKEYQIGQYFFNVTNQYLELGNIRTSLTKKETDVLKMLCIHLNEVTNREETLVKIWGISDYFSGRSMDVFISKIRKYLKDDPKIQIINIHGVGFKLAID